ncbi:MAG: L,D-transpeptidase [Xanthobacteraceae bacterium]|jgi:lipoprotein-anchoring transpeptidase ErfK/SrfK
MVDYYSALLRAVTAPEAGDAQWRRELYDRTRRILTQRLRAIRPPPPMTEIAAEQSALEAAIERIEEELAWGEQGTLAPDARTHERFGDIAAEPWNETERGPLTRPLPAARLALFAVIAAALGASGYVYWTQTAHKQAPPAIKTQTQSSATPAPNRPLVTAKDDSKSGEIAPGIDGGASDPDQPYVFRRQPTFYRTLQPVGTIIVDKLQHFLYLIRPNNVALRYGIGVGSQCKDLVGLRHIASVTEWPEWQPPPDLLKRNPPAMPGGPGNPLGARLLALDDGSSRIHGTNAPRTIGSSVSFGCIRLANDDIVDLSSRVQASTPVVVN